MIHYHGTPITPNAELVAMSGRHFCVSFERPDNLAICLRIGQSVMFDNGAYSAFTRGAAFDEAGFYAWLDPILAPPHWAVVPDAIGAGPARNKEFAERWPFGIQLGRPVWHLNLPLDYLFYLVDDWGTVCFGSSAEFWQVGSDAWCRRMDEAFNALARRDSRLPWVHGLRMLGQAGERWPLASADSTNVAQNFKRDACCAERKAALIDAVQSPHHWTLQPTQRDLCL